MARAVCHSCQSFRERTHRAWADAMPTLKTNVGQPEGWRGMGRIRESMGKEQGRWKVGSPVLRVV